MIWFIVLPFFLGYIIVRGISDLARFAAEFRGLDPIGRAALIAEAAVRDAAIWIVGCAAISAWNFIKFWIFP